MKKLIITADDYGMSLAVNEAIDAGIEAGLITSTNVMPNMPFFENAKKLKEYKSISVGIHFVLSCGKPISKPELIPSLVDENGDFFKYPEFRKKYRKHLIKDKDILIELNAQYEKYVTLLGAPDYWNTHQNVHVDFRIYKLFVDFAKEKNILRMRSHQRIYVKASQRDNKNKLIWRIIEPIKSRMLNCWQNNAHKKGIKSPNGLICCLRNKDVNVLDYIVKNIRWKNNVVGEYVIHPATKADSPFFGKIVEQRITEYKIFTNPNTKEIIEKAGIELDSYNNLI